ncbi:hypothetical protein ACVBGC_22690 [Burkholderia stagnalis]
MAADGSGWRCRQDNKPAVAADTPIAFASTACRSGNARRDAARVAGRSRAAAVAAKENGAAS